MKKLNYYILSAVFTMLFMSSCEDQLNIEQEGVTSVESFYETDDDADEAVAAVYEIWRTTQMYEYWLKNLLADDAYCGGGERNDNSGFEELNEYTFSSSNEYVTSYFSYLYQIIYRANLVINNFDASDSDTKARDIAEAKVFRAICYFDLVTLWGTPPLVLEELQPSEYQQSNSTTDELWSQIEEDLTDAIDGGYLTEKSSQTDATARITKQAAQAYLGKAYLFEEKYSSAATVLKEVISSGLYALYDDYAALHHAETDFCCENILESNAVDDATNEWYMGNNAWFWGFMLNWRIQDTFNPSGIDADSDIADISTYGGYGFLNPKSDLYDAFVNEEGEDGYRLNCTIKTWDEVNADGVTLLTSGAYAYGHEGLFRWKMTPWSGDAITGSYGYVSQANIVEMRYADVLLMAAEACLENGDQSDADTYVNEVRTRALLDSKSSVTLDDIKLERRLELCFEGVRFQDLIRWGDASTYLADQGSEYPSFSGYDDDGSSWNVTWTTLTGDYGFETGKNELLPFPEDEMSVNENITQNTGW